MSVEKLAEEVHNSWWEEKKKQGFHSPFECQSDNHKRYQNSDWKIQDRFDDHFNEKTYRWCDKCHPDMYPYSELSENVKEYDRVTVRTVLAAQDKLKASSKEVESGENIRKDALDWWDKLSGEQRIELSVRHFGKKYMENKLSLTGLLIEIIYLKETGTEQTKEVSNKPS